MVLNLSTSTAIPRKNLSRYLLSFLLVIFTSITVQAEELVIIAHIDFPLNSINNSIIKKIYTGRKRILGRVSIKPIDISYDENIKSLFVVKMLGFRSVEHYNNYWIGKIFREGGTPPQTVRTHQKMLSAISKFPGAIGYCDASKLPERLNGIKILIIK